VELHPRESGKIDMTQTLGRDLTDRDERAIRWAKEQQELPQEQFIHASSFWKERVEAVQSWLPAHKLIDEMNTEPPYVPNYIAHAALRDLVDKGLYEMNALGQIRGTTK